MKMGNELRDKIPGKELDESKSMEISKKIIEALNPNNLSLLELWKKELKRITKEDAIDYYKNNSINEYYMLYTYYVNKKEINYVYIANKQNVINFIKDEFNEEWDEGFDITISDIEFKKIIMGNHDGILVTR